MSLSEWIFIHLRQMKHFMSFAIPVFEAGWLQKSKEKGYDVINVRGGMSAWTGIRSLRSVKEKINENYHCRGVAGGMSAATRLRRLMEGAGITIFEKGPLFPLQTADPLLCFRRNF